MIIISLITLINFQVQPDPRGGTWEGIVGESLSSILAEEGTRERIVSQSLSSTLAEESTREGIVS